MLSSDLGNSLIHVALLKWKGSFDSAQDDSAVYRLGRYKSVLVPKNTSADCMIVSDKVGCG